MNLSWQLLRKVNGENFSKSSLRQASVEETKEFAYIHEPISYEEFVKEYMLPNKPCILGEWCTSTWLSRKEWVSCGNKPNFRFLQDNFGSATCPVANCNQEKYSSHPKEDISLEKYIAYIQEYADCGYTRESQCLYLKDWHFTKAFPEYKAYSTPVYFQSDWMNEYWDALSDTTDDYRFVYFGPKGSWTPFHADVFRSFSWSANICGRKRWIFFPPGEEENLKDNLGHLAFDLRSPQMDDTNMYPNSKNVKRRFEVIQEAGEVVFVPSGWHHQVFNLEDTISINHNWMNGCNVDISWEFLKEKLGEVKREIQDCKEMEGWDQQCQLILRADSGISYMDFYCLLCHIGKSRMDDIQIITGEESDGGICIKENKTMHQLFDLIMIRNVIKDMIDLPDFMNIIDNERAPLEPHQFYSNIEKLLSKYFQLAINETDN